jgi:predicted nucleotidyltransferase
VLIGSRTNGTTRPDSDWDIAIQWTRSPDLLGLLGKTETLRRKLASLLVTSENRIDLIDLPNARLAIRAVVAEQGVPLSGGESLAWHRLLQRTWRELEEYQWEKTDAA